MYKSIIIVLMGVLSVLAYSPKYNDEATYSIMTTTSWGSGNRIDSSFIIYPDGEKVFIGRSVNTYSYPFSIYTEKMVTSYEKAVVIIVKSSEYFGCGPYVNPRGYLCANLLFFSVKEKKIVKVNSIFYRYYEENRPIDSVATIEIKKEATTVDVVVTTNKGVEYRLSAPKYTEDGAVSIAPKIKYVKKTAEGTAMYSPLGRKMMMGKPANGVYLRKKFKRLIY